MREVRKYKWAEADHYLLAKLVPGDRGLNRTPMANMGEGRVAYFREDQPTDIEVLCWCFPTEGYGVNSNYHALPISELDALNAMVLLNRCVDVREGQPSYDISVEAMSTIMDELDVLRPDKILCAEQNIASQHTWKKLLRSAGFRKGNPNVQRGEVCYLGTFYDSKRGNFLAAGVNAAVLVENFTPKRREEIGRDYVGPIYVAQEISRPGTEFRMYKGFALPWIDGRLRDMLKERYAKSSDDVVHTAVRKNLGMNDLKVPSGIDPELWRMVQGGNGRRRGR